MASNIYLGFDHGELRIGVAVGEQLLGTARPLKILRAKHGQPNWDEVSKLIKEWQPAALIVGLPIRHDGSHNASTEAAERFMRRLHGRFGLQIHSIDETLSSVAAEEYSQDEFIDDVAAQVILETWFGEQAGKGE